MAEHPRPALHYVWSDLRPGDVLAVGVPGKNALGEDGCIMPSISVGVLLPADGAVGTGKSLHTTIAPGCKEVVVSKTVVANGVETDAPADEPSPVNDPLSPRASVFASHP
jgi:hypothetical protein